jgi:hypothetical protein
MDNNTQIETVSVAAKNYAVSIHANNVLKVFKEYSVKDFTAGASWQKQQDEAKYNSLSVDELLLEREKIEKLIRSKDEMALVNYELKQLGIDELPKSYITDLEYKYKELLDSHNKLLIALENSAEYLRNNKLYAQAQELINKAKNIKL